MKRDFSCTFLLSDKISILICLHRNVHKIISVKSLYEFQCIHKLFFNKFHKYYVINESIYFDEFELSLFDIFSKQNKICYRIIEYDERYAIIN